MALVPQVKAQLDRPVYFAWAYGKEVGCLKDCFLPQSVKSKGAKNDDWLVGDLTSNEMIVAHKLICTCKLHVKRTAAHWSGAVTKNSCNAIDYGARLVFKICKIAEGIVRNGESNHVFSASSTIMSMSVIHGGIAIKTIPVHCIFNYEFCNPPRMAHVDSQQCAPGYVASDPLPETKECSGAGIVIENLLSVPSLHDAHEKKMPSALVSAMTGGRDMRKLGGSTEADQYALIGVPLIVYGPGSIKVANQENELVPKKHLNGCGKKRIMNITRKNHDMQSHMCAAR
ncbi:Peptidase dimerisation domain containing protein [Leishmania donovani]|uniref:Peptidase dimerization domain containing protein, putative n=2 Tax=Leishmania donovani TaxID=5661 RepID=A0A3S7WPP6_LEIDO|nr:Peptidase dimerization domain containing protein, putative [Leishmania donovani]CAJ1986238.1 Peptidase dimerisation domain containing protein [Leishmania donovani]VDZ42137.1 Peptidase_dimerisation_domain_containing_protein_putative/Pfam:PF07687 [Leishmania donovani]